MKKIALIGFPLAQTMSNEFFTDFFRKNNIDMQHQLIELKDINDFQKIVAQENFSGFNITIPHKEKIIPYLDFLDKTAQKVGAVNTIAVKSGKLIGYNTDIYGFEKSIEKFLNTSRKNALILGTGGAAKAVKYVLDNKEINSKFVSRTKSNGNFVYSELNRQIIENQEIIINATPVGMLPEINFEPKIPYEFLAQNCLLFDLICKPQKTLFLQQGEKRGCETSNGIQMFEYQAIESYKIWNL